MGCGEGGLEHAQTGQEAHVSIPTGALAVSVGGKARPLTVLLPTCPRSISDVLATSLEVHSQEDAPAEALDQGH